VRLTSTEGTAAGSDADADEVEADIESLRLMRRSVLSAAALAGGGGVGVAVTVGFPCDDDSFDDGTVGAATGVAFDAGFNGGVDFDADAGFDGGVDFDADVEVPVTDLKRKYDNEICA